MERAKNEPSTIAWAADRVGATPETTGQQATHISVRTQTMVMIAPSTPENT